MPPFNHKGIVVKDNNTHDYLGHYDANTSAYGHPSKHVDGAYSVTLFLVRLDPTTRASKHTIPLAYFFGASIAVQWYCPPAVGYLALSSARLSAVAPIRKRMTMQP